MKVLSLMSCFQACRSGKGTGNPQGIWLWRPVGFNYRTSKALLDKDSILKGDKQNLSAPWPTGKEEWPHRRPKQTYLLKLESPVEVGQQWLAVGARALAVAILEGAPQRESPWKLQKIKTSFINNVSYFYSTRRARIGFWTLFGFWSFTSNTAAPGGDITSKYGQGTLWKRELGSNQGQPRTGEQNHALHSACSLLPASACVWLSALTWDFYSFTIIHVCIRSKHFLVILLSQRVSYELIGMLLEVWNPEIGMLFSIQQRKVLTLKALWNYHPRWKENTFARGLAPFQCCLPVTVSDQLSCLLPEGSHTDSHSPDDFCQNRLMPLVWYGLIESRQ